MRRFGIPAREWIWAQPRRARVIAVGAAMVALSVAAGAAVVQRSGDGPEGRLRHRRFAGATSSGTGDLTTTSEAPDAPGATGGPSGPAGGGPASSPAGPAAAPAAPSPAAPSSSGPASPPASSKTGSPGSPAAGQAPPGTTRPGAPGSAPAPDTAAGPGWHPLPTAPITGRAGHTAVWTGREMVIWGGTGDFEADPLTDGAAFDPAARTWRKVPAAPLTPRFDARAFWTGGEMIVFGGAAVGGDVLADGAAWDPASNAWRAIPAPPIGGRAGAVVAWAGDRLVVWGGATVPPSDAAPDAAADMPNDGSAWVPATGRWVPVPAAAIPGRSGAESAWTGTRLVISGGYREGDDADRTDGAALDPLTGAWSPIAARPDPGSCGGGSACDGVWTGRGALFATSSLLYEPAGDRWSAVAPAPDAGAPAPGEPAVWTGRRLLVWGLAAAGDGAGDDGPVDEETGDAPINAGATYDPGTSRWQPFAAGPLSGRGLHTAVWTGQEMLVWGGSAGDASLADGAAYRPEP